jgi:hypothetical protein
VVGAVSGVDHVQSVDLLEAPGADQLFVPGHHLVASGTHEVEVV